MTHRPISSLVAHAPSLDWDTYLGGAARDADAFSERVLNVSDAPNLTPLWNYTTGRTVSASPAIVDGRIYEGSWDGYEYCLNASTGGLIWKHFLGTDTAVTHPIGVASSATVEGKVVYVGGGNAFWYALNTTNGKVLWKFNTGNQSMGYFNWASPLISKGYAYIGIASRGDNPLVRGGLDMVSLASHHLVKFLNTTAKGALGASIWTSPAANAATNTVFVTTGNPGPGVNGSVWGQSILALNGSDLRIRGHWTVPAAQATIDGDFGATPMVFTTASGATLVAASNKNGIFYVWNQTRLSHGPIWNRTVANPSPLSGTPNLGPAAWGGGRVYVGTSATTIGNVSYKGSVQVFSPLSGRLLWERNESGAVLGAPVFANGLLVVAAGTTLQVLDASNGRVLFQFNSPALFQDPPAISNGEIVIGAANGTIYAFGL